MAELKIDITPWLDAYRRAEEYIDRYYEFVAQGGSPSEGRRFLDLATAAVVNPFGETESDGDKVARAVMSAWNL